MKYSIRNFLLVFTISLVLFIAAAFYCVNYVDGFLDEMFGNAKTIGNTETAEQTQTKSAPSTEAPETGEIIEKKDNISFMIIGKDKINGNADAIVLIKIDKISKQILLTSIPMDSRLFYDGQYKKLSNALVTHDESFIAGKVRAMTGINVDYYMTFTMDGFVNLIDTIGGVTYYVKQDMYYSDPVQDLVIDIKRGNQTLSGRTALDMLRFKGYLSGDSGRTVVHREFIKAFFTAFLIPENIMRLSEITDILYDSVTTSFTRAAFNANADMIFSISEFDVKDITYPGSSYKDNGEQYFVPDIEKALELFNAYR